MGVVTMGVVSYEISRSPNQTEVGPNHTVSSEAGETGQMWGGRARLQLDFLLLLVAVEENLDLCFNLQLGLTRRLEHRGIPGRDGVLAVSVITGNRQLPSS